MPENLDQENNIAWPTDEGIWMGFVELKGEVVGWLPFKTIWLIDDDRQPGKRLLIAAQWLRGPGDWPYTLQGCHPVKIWRRPTPEELTRAKHFYGMPD